MNPYAAPQAVVAQPVDASYSSAIHASYGKRFVGSLIDTILAVVAGTVLSRGFSAAMGMAPSQVITHACFIVPQIVNWVLLTQRGQSIGKIAMGTKVIRDDGGRVGFMQAVGLRALPFVLLGLLPLAFEPMRFVVSIVGLTDALFIFRGGESRTIHDRLAATIVIDVKATHARYGLALES